MQQVKEKVAKARNMERELRKIRADADNIEFLSERRAALCRTLQKQLQETQEALAKEQQQRSAAVAGPSCYPTPTGASLPPVIATQKHQTPQSKIKFHISANFQK